jgi:hypothetical protein
VLDEGEREHIGQYVDRIEPVLQRVRTEFALASMGLLNAETSDLLENPQALLVLLHERHVDWSNRRQRGEWISTCSRGIVVRGCR